MRRLHLFSIAFLFTVGPMAAQPQAPSDIALVRTYITRHTGDAEALKHVPGHRWVPLTPLTPAQHLQARTMRKEEAHRLHSQAMISSPTAAPAPAVLSLNFNNSYWGGLLGMDPSDSPYRTIEYTSVSAEIPVPSFGSCVYYGNWNQFGQQWIGLDGESNTGQLTLEQAGVSGGLLPDPGDGGSTCTASYYSWWEGIDANNDLYNVGGEIEAVNPWDAVFLTITGTPGSSAFGGVNYTNAFTVTYLRFIYGGDDYTSFTTVFQEPDAPFTSAEAIIEIGEWADGCPWDCSLPNLFPKPQPYWLLDSVDPNYYWINFQVGAIQGETAANPGAPYSARNLSDLTAEDPSMGLYTFTLYGVNSYVPIASMTYGDNPYGPGLWGGGPASGGYLWLTWLNYF